MVRYLDIARSVTSTLTKTFPNIPVYGDEVTEGYNKPCFFIGLYPVDTTTETRHIATTTILIVVTYFTNDKNSLANYDMMNQLKRAFGITLEVGERKLLIENSETEKANEDGDTFQFSFSISYKEVITDAPMDDVPTAKDINYRTKLHY